MTDSKINITNVRHYPLQNQQQLKIVADISINGYLNQNCRAIVYLYNKETNQYISAGYFGSLIPIYNGDNQWIQTVAYVSYNGNYNKKLMYFMDVVDGSSTVIHKTNWYLL